MGNTFNVETKKNHSRNPQQKCNTWQTYMYVWEFSLKIEKSNSLCMHFALFWPFYQIKGVWEKSGRGENLVLRKCENRGNTADCATSPSLIVLLLANRQTGRDYIEVSQRQERKCISHKTRLGKVKDAFFHEKRNIWRSDANIQSDCPWVVICVLLH